jgi:hypothetical protein
VRHSFDTIKVRLQTSPPDRFKGPLDCLLKTLRNEGFRGVYKGATPPLVGWMFMDSVWVDLDLYLQWHMLMGFQDAGFPLQLPRAPQNARVPRQ